MRKGIKMNKFKLDSFAADVAVYLYQPEGKGSWGKIRFDRRTGKAEIIEKASETTPRYDHKAINKIEERCLEKSLPFEFTQAWV